MGCVARRRDPSAFEMKPPSHISLTKFWAKSTVLPISRTEIIRVIEADECSDGTDSHSGASSSMVVFDCASTGLTLETLSLLEVEFVVVVVGEFNKGVCSFSPSALELAITNSE